MTPILDITGQLYVNFSNAKGVRKKNITEHLNLKC